MLLLRAIRTGFLALPLLGAGLQPEASAAAGEASPVQKFGERYCFDCHGPKKQKGDFNLVPLAAKPDVVRQRKVWENIADLLESREMPPEGKPQPTEQERQALVKWIDEQLDAGASGQTNPGRVTLRRLNREEYRNTIRDLTGVDFDPADFPQDETAFGFDTIADVLTLPPLLMEKYLAAAEQIVSRVLAGSRTEPRSESYRAERMKPSNSEWVRPVGKGALGLYREGEAVDTVEFRGDGEYLLRFRAYGEQAGPEAPKLAVSLDDRLIEVFYVKNSGKPAPYEVKATVKGGSHRLSIAYLNNYNGQNSPDPKLRGDRNLFVTGFDIVGPIAANAEPSAAFRRVFWKLPEPGAEKRIARELLGSFASRAYRRPVTPAETERLGKLVDAALADKLPFNEAVGVGLQAILCSPVFIFRWELDPDSAKPGGIRALNDYEVASRLSYFLWSSMPDQELSDLAAKGELSKGENLRRQVARMLADWRAQAFVRNFSSQWLQIRALDEVEIDRSKFPKFDGRLREAMKEETRLFFDAIVRENRPIHELIETDFTFVNRRLAELYGLPAPKGDKFERVQLPPGSPRGGVLGQGSVLLATSMPTRTSPVVRGKWVLEQLLGTPPPPPPANVPPLEDAQVDKDAPLRLRLEQHRANADCAVCHDKIDPVGFALENFDAIGAWRTTDGRNRIDASAILPGGVKVDGVAGLKSYLRSEKFVRAFAGKLMTYGLGRGIERQDKAALDSVVRQTLAGGSRISALIEAIVTSDPFLKRKRDVAAR